MQYINGGRVEITPEGEPSMPAYKLVSFKDKKNKIIKFFFRANAYEDEFEEGITLGRRKKNPHDYSGRFQEKCNARTISTRWKGTCSRGNCISESQSLPGSYYKISDEYRSILFLKKQSRTYKINRPIKSEQGSF